MSSATSRIRVRLLVIALLAVLPGAALMIAAAVADFRRQNAEAQEEALRMARLLSANQEALLEGGRQLLISLAQTPAVRSGDPTACSGFLSQLISQYPWYANFGVATPQGDLYCSAVPLSDRVNIADRSYFRRAVETRTFALGEYQIGRVTGKPGVNFAYPVLDERRNVQAIVFAAFDLTLLNQLAEGSSLPNGAAFTVIDGNGTILARYPEPQRWLGQTLAFIPIIEAMLSGKEGKTITTGVDEVERVYGFTTIGRGGSRAYVAVGLPKAEVIGVANRALAGNIAILVLATSIACLLAQLSGEALIHRPFTRLMALVNGQAQKDPVTGMFSRTVFMQHLHQALDKLQGRPTKVGVLLVDLDQFRTVNETLGHAAGDHVLALVGQRLSDAVRIGDIVARYGEDEFIILLEGLRSDDDVVNIARKVLERSQAPYEVKNEKVALTLSVGAAVSDPDCNEDELVRRAKVAVYEAKIEGGACSVLYGAEKDTRTSRAFTWQPGMGT